MAVIRSFAALLLLTSVATGADLRTLSGKVVQGDLLSLSDKEIVLRGDNGPITTPLADVLPLDLQGSSAVSATVKCYQVTLTDGSVLQCGQFLPRGKEVELPLAAA